MPPDAGLPVSQVRGSIGAALAQIENGPPLPASGACTTLMVTVLVAEGHGAVPATVYVYEPGASAAALNVGPWAAPFGSVHVPPADGPPPKALTKLNGAPLLLQRAWFPLVPAETAVEMVTSTCAEVAGQGPFAGSV